MECNIQDPTFVSENSYRNFLRKKVFAKVTFLNNNSAR